MLSHPDQFGFYRVGEHKFYSKIEAIELHTKSGILPHWDFNDSVYSLHDWTVEPTESLSELYRQRAQQIRDSYDHLVLWYSSGADSDAVFRAFADNNIVLDELACFVNYDANSDKDDLYNNGEIYNIALKKAQKYQEQNPDCQLRVIDTCQHVMDFWNNKENMFNWKYSMNSIYSINSTIRSRLPQLVKEWKHLSDSGKTVAFIWGVDKPRVNLIDNKYHFQFLDIIDCYVNPDLQRNPISGQFMEFFFWSPNLPQLIIKQAHVLKNYLRAATVNSQFMQKESSGLGFIVEQDQKHWITATGVNCLMYPNFEYNFLNDWKPSAFFFSPRDQWFLNLTDNVAAKKNWETSLKDLWRSVPDYWKNNPKDINKAFKGCLSRPYCLE
jgi:hypothetical protein